MTLEAIESTTLPQPDLEKCASARSEEGTTGK